MAIVVKAYEKSGCLDPKNLARLKGIYRLQTKSLRKESAQALRVVSRDLFAQLHHPLGARGMGLFVDYLIFRGDRRTRLLGPVRVDGFTCDGLLDPMGAHSLFA